MLSLVAVKPYEPTFITLGKTVFDKKERGRRLAYLRVNVAGCATRQEFRDAFDIQVNTLRSWESGSINGLTPKGAKKIASHADKLNIYCSDNWLMYGIGHHPTYRHKGFVEPDKKLEEEIVSEALAFYEKDSKNDKLVAVVEDDSLLPIVEVGDYVGGEVVVNPKEAIEQNCIIIDDEGNRYIRVLRYSEEPNKYNLGVLNPTSSQKTIEKVAVAQAAPIVWSRKP